jgi:hypothetical protein
VEDGGDEITLRRISGEYVVIKGDGFCSIAGLGVKFQKKMTFLCRLVHNV